jgi:hypothetical protein
MMCFCDLPDEVGMFVVTTYCQVTFDTLLIGPHRAAACHSTLEAYAHMALGFALLREWGDTPGHHRELLTERL